MALTPSNSGPAKGNDDGGLVLPPRTLDPSPSNAAGNTGESAAAPSPHGAREDSKPQQPTGSGAQIGGPASGAGSTSKKADEEKPKRSHKDSTDFTYLGRVSQHA